MSIERQHPSRRAVLKIGMAKGFVLVPALAGGSGIVNAAGHDPSGAGTTMDALISVLNGIGKPGCVATARGLAALDPSTASFDLHLRGAGLEAGDALVLADTLHETSGSSGPALRSFSASYNPDLTDAGVVALAEAFPSKMAELGLVGCSIGDAAGLAILSWARTAAGPRMICVEANHFSADVKSAFARLPGERRSLLVVV